MTDRQGLQVEHARLTRLLAHASQAIRGADDRIAADQDKPGRHAAARVGKARVDRRALVARQRQLQGELAEVERRLRGAR